MSMYNNRKGPNQAPCPSDAQAREKLALYVYEYLHHIGAKGAADTFLKEIRWEKNITLGDPPGFLHSWWCVFWDLYCAAPERRDSCEHSQEAKAFHDYGFVSPSQFPPPQVNGMHGPPNATPSPLGMPPQVEGMPPGSHPIGPGGGHPGFFPGGVPVRPSPPQGPSSVSQSSPHPGGPGIPTSCYSGGPRALFPSMRPPPLGGPPRMGSEGSAGGPPIPFGGPGAHAMFSPHDLRPGVPHMMPPGGQRLPASGAGHPRMPANPNFGMRPPNSAQMVVRPWPPSSSAMQYSDSPSAGGHFSGPPTMMSNGPVSVGTPNLPTASPGGSMSHSGDVPDRFGGMLPVTNPGSVPSSFGMSSEGMGGGGDGGGLMLNGGDLDMKNSPASNQGLNGGTPGPGGAGGGRTSSGGPASVPSQGPTQSNSDSMDFTTNSFPGGESEASEIDKIKRSMIEESKRFESKVTESGAGGDSDFY